MIMPILLLVVQFFDNGSVFVNHVIPTYIYIRSHKAVIKFKRFISSMNSCFFYYLFKYYR